MLANQRLLNLHHPAWLDGLLACGLFASTFPDACGVSHGRGGRAMAVAPKAGDAASAAISANARPARRKGTLITSRRTV